MQSFHYYSGPSASLVDYMVATLNFSCNFVAAQHSNASPDTNGTTDMDVFMDDIADIMDIDDVTEQSEAEGSGMTLDLEMEDVLNTADRSTPFDSFVAYFAEVICPESWMDEE
ncbi:hypothetical protein F5879DRAFT_988041 [Lentinula edodes]|nr:hypothetical protein F5879DRAFT_988041 [Lentinula edodes]